MEKARSSCNPTGPDLILCAARDIPSSTQASLSRNETQQILRCNFSSSKNQGALPGFVPLFIGMPIILRTQNLSTDLKITNGSQGYVRKIDVETSPDGLTYCSCVLVEFLDSPVQLDGLPQGYFPITPVTWSFMASFVRDADGQHERIRLSLYQVPIQPGFAVTGHSSQGKSLPKVLVSLHDGGFAAYVAASRAMS
jgi:ATP-dependent exoDNAse (exonuclease V) alpha subunit